MALLRPGWFVVLCGAVLLGSSWLPWLVTFGGRATAIGGALGAITVPPAGFGVGQGIVLLGASLMVAAAMAARGLHARAASAAALVLSLTTVLLVAWYYRLYVADAVHAGYGLWVGAGAMAAAVLASVVATAVAFSAAVTRTREVR